jgi:hypothetical protein
MCRSWGITRVDRQLTILIASRKATTGVNSFILFFLFIPNSSINIEYFCFPFGCNFANQLLDKPIQGEFEIHKKKESIFNIETIFSDVPKFRTVIKLVNSLNQASNALLEKNIQN